MHVTVINCHKAALIECRCAKSCQLQRESALITLLNLLTLDFNDLVVRSSLNCRCLVLGAKTDARDNSEPSRDCSNEM